MFSIFSFSHNIRHTNSQTHHHPFKGIVWKEGKCNERKELVSLVRALTTSDGNSRESILSQERTVDSNTINNFFLPATTSSLSFSYLKILKVVGISRPVHLGKEVLIQHLAEQLKQVHFALIVSLETRRN